MIPGLTEEQRDALDRLARCVDSSTYLAGGVAVALRLHHRRSRDLDLFSPSANPLEYVETIAATEPSARITSQSEGTLYLEVKGVPASWIRYRYPLLAPAERLPGVAVPVATLEDLMSMKLSAIASRGAARDFWDLDAMLAHTQTQLSEALDAFARKYATHDRGHVVKSLAYFADADSAPLPAGLDLSHWARIKADFVRRVEAL
jgi:hypothetical protein